MVFCVKIYTHFVVSKPKDKLIKMHAIWFQINHLHCLIGCINLNKYLWVAKWCGSVKWWQFYILVFPIVIGIILDLEINIWWGKLIKVTIGWCVDWMVIKRRFFSLVLVVFEYFVAPRFLILHLKVLKPFIHFNQPPTANVIFNYKIQVVLS